MGLECLQNIIGLTRSTCEVFIENLGDEPAAEWYKKSASGLFLDEVPGIVSIKGVEQSLSCQTELASFFQTAIESAKTELTSDFIVGLKKRYSQANKNYAGRAGGVTYNQDISFNTGYAGVHLKTQWIRGGRLTIKSIYGIFQTPPTQLMLYRVKKQTYNLEFVKNIPVTFTPNVATNFPLVTPEVLDMDGYEYFMLYDPTGVIAKNNNVSCGCGYTETLMQRYISLVGLSGSDLAAYNTWSMNANAGGLAFEIEAGCDSGSILCEVFDGDMAYSTVIAHAIRYKAAELVTEKALGSEEVNRYTMMSREYLWGKRNHFQKEYLDRVTWLVETLDIGSVTDCYVCNTSHKKINKSGLLI